MCAGFFSVCLLEVSLHKCLGRRGHGGRVADSSEAYGGAIRRRSSSHNPELDTISSMGEANYQSMCSEASTTAAAVGSLSLTPSEFERVPGGRRNDREALSALRTLFVVSALSFHSVAEGLTLSLEKEEAGVWLNFGALSLHKFVVSFSVGVELIATWVRKKDIVNNQFNEPGGHPLE